jgi:hypothetical protein
MVVGRAEEKTLDHQTVHRHDHRRVQGSPRVAHRLVGVGEHREVGACPVPNKALHLTASSVRSCVAPASGSR